MVGWENSQAKLPPLRMEYSSHEKIRPVLRIKGRPSSTVIHAAFDAVLTEILGTRLLSRSSMHLLEWAHDDKYALRHRTRLAALHLWRQLSVVRLSGSSHSALTNVVCLLSFVQATSQYLIATMTP